MCIIHEVVQEWLYRYTLYTVRVWNIYTAIKAPMLRPDHASLPTHFHIITLFHLGGGGGGGEGLSYTVEP